MSPAATIQPPPHQIGFGSDLPQPTPLKATEALPVVRLAPPLFDRFVRSLRTVIAHSPAQPAHPLMHFLSSRHLGRNVRGTAPPEECGQNGVGTISLVRPYGLDSQAVRLMEGIDHAAPPCRRAAGPPNGRHSDAPRVDADSPSARCSCSPPSQRSHSPCSPVWPRDRSSRQASGANGAPRET
jgi:hypothetical protein